MNRSAVLSTLAAIVLAAGSAFATPEPGVTLYHVGVENRPTFTSGTYNGQANPNHNRLTFFLSHTFSDTPKSNHFHRIGSYGLTGPAASPTVALSTNDNLPEPYQGDDGLSLLPGSGAFAGKLISGLGPVQLPGNHIEAEYGTIRIEPMDALLPFDGQDHPNPGSLDPAYVAAPPALKHPKHHLVNTSGGVYNNSIAGTTVGLELVSLSPGLTIHDGSGALLMDSVGDVITLGPGANWVLDPVFAVEGSAAIGTKFAAEFVLKDLSTAPTYGNSAPFTFDFIVAEVPEPAGLALIALGLVGTWFASRGKCSK